MCTELTRADLEFPEERLSHAGEVITLQSAGLPVPSPAEADVFARHEGIPGHDQRALAGVNIVMVGAGGLNSWAALALLRSGADHLTIIDSDFVERTNMPRQYYFGRDLGQPKVTRLIENLREHAMTPASLTGMAMRFEDAVENFAVPADLLVIGVDRNDCRKYGVELARRLGIPAVFTMLSADGMRCHSFLQGPNRSDACLWCALPNLDPEHILPCASAVITSCMLASAFTVFFVHRALMGWPQRVTPFNWRAADLLGMAPDNTGLVARRPDCKVCAGK